MSSRNIMWTEAVERPPPDVRARLHRILLMSDMARCKDDYEFLDRYVHSVTYFADLPPRDRLRYLRIVKGVELERGEELFHIGDAADAFYCVMYGSLNVVVDFAHVAAPTMTDFDDIINRARIHSTFLYPGGTLDVQGTSYVVRNLKVLECFGDVGLLTSDQQRTASVVANEKSLCMKIDREAFLDLRKSYSDRELREKVKFLASVAAFDHWDADSILRLTGRMEKVNASYNDIVVKEGEEANDVYFVKHGECRLVKQFPTLRINKQRCFVEVCSISSRHYFGAYEVVTGSASAQFSVLVSSPSAILYRIDRVDFRQTVLKDQATEAMIRSDCVELAQRIREDNVRKDLECDVRWSQYKRDIVVDILETHQREHASPLHGQRSPRASHGVGAKTRPAQITTVAVSTSPRSRHARLAARAMMSPSRPLQQPLQGPPGSPTNNGKRPSRWLHWAKQRASDIMNDSGDSAAEAGMVDELKSNIQWGKSSKIMGGLDDEAKITSAIVSLFDPRVAHT